MDYKPMIYKPLDSSVNVPCIPYLQFSHIMAVLANLGIFEAHKFGL